MQIRSRLLTTIATAAALLLAGGPARAFDIFPFGTNQALKWGASNQIGTPGGTVTWSLVPDGTPFDPLIASFDWSGTSDLASIYAQVGGEAAALAALQSAFDAWSQASGIQFVQITESGGTLPVGAASAGAVVVGQIRVSAFAFAPGDFTAAVGFAAPPNGGTTLEGDLIFNVSNRFGLPSGHEGDLFDLFPPPSFFYLNDFAGLAGHEIGHTLGLAHSDVPNSMMCGYLPPPGLDASQCHWADPDGDGRAPITHRPKQDDVSGILHLYGVPEPQAASMLMAGGALVAAIARRRARAARG